MQAKIREVKTALVPDDVEPLVDHLKSTVAGTYHRNHCLIKLDQDYSYWNPANEPTLGRLAVFVHEYLHFIHNFSTVVGLYDFVVQLRLLRPFCNTVGSNGRSVGSVVLSDEAQSEIRNLLRWRTHLRGSVTSLGKATLNRLRTHPSFLEYAHSVQPIQLAGQSIDCNSLLVSFDVSSLGLDKTTVEVSVGSEVLMECCAVECERILYERHGIASDFVLNNVPVYPYHTARTIFEGISQISPSSEFLCSICILALQSTDPGDAFIQIAEACKSEDGLIDEAAKLSSFKERSDTFMTGVVQRILTETLPLEIAPFRNRGHAGRGLDRMKEWGVTLFNERLKDTWFDINAVNKAPDLQALVDLIQAMPACPIIQVVDKLNNREELLYFSQDDIVENSIITELGVAQALLQFSAAHLTSMGEIIPTPDSSQACFFVDLCDAPLAVERSSICRRSPWQSFDPVAAHSCWYGQAVTAARARRDDS
jgi:hypothetical protein